MRLLTGYWGDSSAMELVGFMDLSVVAATLLVALVLNMECWDPDQPPL